MPPIYQPEVAAKAIYWAAHNKRREIFVGGSTVQAIYAQDVAPSFADWYLGRHAYGAQQTSQPVAPDRPDNLFEPVQGDYAADGIFGAEAKSFSVQSWINLHRLSVTMLSAGVLGLAALLWKRNV